MEFKYSICRPSPLRMVPQGFGEARVETEVLPSLLQLRACKDPIGTASGLLEAGTANLQQRTQG